MISCRCQIDGRTSCLTNTDGERRWRWARARAVRAGLARWPCSAHATPIHGQRSARGGGTRGYHIADQSSPSSGNRGGEHGRPRRHGRCAAPGRGGGRGPLRLCRHVYHESARRGRHAARRGHLRVPRRRGRAHPRADRPEHQPVVPGRPPNATLPLRHQRDRRLRRSEDRLGRGVRDRPGDRDAYPAESTSDGRPHPCTPGRRARWPHPGDRQLRGRQFRRPADRDRWHGRPGDQYDPAHRQRAEHGAPGGTAPPLCRLRSRRALHRLRRPRDRYGPGLPAGHGGEVGRRGRGEDGAGGGATPPGLQPG